MKKIVIILLILTTSVLIYKEQKEDTIIIPNSAIRLRVIPNSNSSIDQKMKNKIKEYLEKNTYTLLKKESNIDEARKIIKNSIPNIEENVSKIFEENNYIMNYRVNYGYNYFPEKEYHNTKYEEGYYESIVITIGEAKGDNWWCVLFPNLCLADLEQKENIKYKSWVVQAINKIF